MPIQNVPTEEDFKNHALGFLNFSWDSVFDLIINKYDAEYGWGIDLDEEEEEKYKHLAQRPLSIAFAMAQQGAELALKSRIVAKSPYFLIKGDPRGWPSKCDKQDIDYADFRTIDSQDLIKVFKTIYGNTLPQDLAEKFEYFRKQRNTLIHTVDYRLKYSINEILSYILNIAHLITPTDWPIIRRDYLEDSPESSFSGTYGIMNRVCNEFSLLIEMMGYNDLKYWFNFSKRQRSYICPNCYYQLNRDTDVEFPETAILQPNTKISKTLYCFVCKDYIKVIRKECKNSDCLGNVIHDDNDSECLICFESYPCSDCV